MLREELEIFHPSVGFCVLTDTERLRLERARLSGGNADRKRPSGEALHRVVTESSAARGRFAVAEGVFHRSRPVSAEFQIHAGTFSYPY